MRLGVRLVKGLANDDAAAIIAARGDEPFASAAALVQLAEADAFRPSLCLARREALWSLKGLHDDPLPLFAAASERERRTIIERIEPSVSLRHMVAGREVVEDYGHVLSGILCVRP